jgi:hypothetical protein
MSFSFRELDRFHHWAILELQVHSIP